MESMIRSAGSYMTKLKLPDVTKLPEVKAHAKDLLDEIGIDHESATTATPRMLELTVKDGGVIDTRYRNSFIAAREKVQFVTEGLGGCRIGEVAGGGDDHGLLANNVCILEDMDPVRAKEREKFHGIGGVVVESYLEHSKTGFGRYLDMAGVTVGSKVNAGKIMRDYWEEAGFTVRTYMQQGVKVSRPDHWVVRVSLLGLHVGHASLEKLVAMVYRNGRRCTRPYARTIEVEARARAAISGVGLQKRKYINVAIGDMSEGNKWMLEETRDEMVAAGFTAEIMPGPLLIATTGGRYPKMKTMPLAVGSTFKPTKELLVMAHEKANADPMDPDPDLELAPGEVPKWSTHSLRRLADTVARRYRKEMEVTEAQIDIYFGWQERLLKKAMQVHYEGLSLLARMALAKITGML